MNNIKRSAIWFLLGVGCGSLCTAYSPFPIVVGALGWALGWAAAKHNQPDILFLPNDEEQRQLEEYYRHRSTDGVSDWTGHGFNPRRRD